MMDFKRKSRNYIKRFKKWIKGVVHLEENSSFNTIEVIVIIIIAIIFGVIVGCILTYGKGFAKIEGNKYAQELLDTYYAIVDNYYEDIEEADLVNSAIDGMVSSLGDQYSYYMDATMTSDFNQHIDGSYVGIGATVSYAEGKNTIIEIFDNSPAFKAGIEVGDVILSVNNIDISEYTLAEVSDLLVGDKGTKINLKVRRGDEEKTFIFTRDTVVIPSVYSKIVEIDNKNIGYIQIDTFAANTYSQFSKHLKSLEKGKIVGLVIDVRDNTGGHLSQVGEILSLFFDKKTVLYQMETKGTTEKVYSSSKDSRKYDIVVLINHNSASASEILASSFQDNYKNATIVGVTSYGKGTVQNAITLSTGASLKYTTQKWLTANGCFIEGVGVTPDVEVNQAELEYEKMSDADLQFKKALEILAK